MLQPVVQVG